MPPETPPEKDLRDSLGSKAHTPQPYTSPSRPYDYAPQQPVSRPVPPQSEPQKPYSEVVEESGLTGIRIVAKLIDVFALWAIMQLLLTPINVIPGAMGWFGVDEDEFTEQMEAVETFDELFNIMIEMLIAYMIFAIVVYAILMFVYFFFGEYMTKQTLGKKAFGLRVIDQRSGRMTASQAAMRAFLTTLSIMFYFWVVDILIMLVRQDGKSVIDTITGTTVIRVKKIFHYPGR